MRLLNQFNQMIPTEAVLFCQTPTEELKAPRPLYVCLYACTYVSVRVHVKDEGC